MRAASQGEQAKIELASFGSVGLAEGSVAAFGKAQTLAEMRIVDVLAATGQLSGTHFGIVIVLRLLRTDHACGQVTGASYEDAQPALGQPPLEGVERQHFRSPAR
ncbi:hypothetical protein ACFYWO_30725 [Streptomyces sp. NPDC002932]|uniref:hypothetical protein n=1 Tax=Streptomyces sp. NPDC002932 TaxID=3364672 RepID=UPI0036AF059B